MNRYLLACFFLLVGKTVFSQLTVNVIDGFTLENISSYVLADYDESMKVSQLSASSFRIHQPKLKEQLTITSPGFVPTDLRIESRKKETLDIVLQPTDSLLDVYHSQFDYYMSREEAQEFSYLLDPHHKKPEGGTDILVEYPGGKEALYKYLVNEIRYPQRAVELNISGKVYALFTVNENGQVENVRIVFGVNHPMDKECIRIINNMSDWKTGSKNNSLTARTFSLPLNFKLM